MEFEQKCYPGSHPRILVTDEFIERNRLSLRHTPEEIAAKIKKDGDLFSFGPSVWVEYLPWEASKEFLNPEYVTEMEKANTKPKQITDVREAAQDLLDYMVFGWSKALDERGISASRTINKIAAWLWILGRQDLEELVSRDSLYNPYGMPALIAVSQQLGIEVPSDCREFAGRPVEDQPLDTTL